MKLELSRQFDDHPDAVWAVISDSKRYEHVAPNLATVEVLDGEGEGMTRACTDTDGRRWTETVTAWEPDRRYAVAVDVAESQVHRRLFDSFGYEVRLEPNDDGVLVTMTFEYAMRFGPLGWMVAKTVGAWQGTRLAAAILDGWADAVANRPE